MSTALRISARWPDRDELHVEDERLVGTDIAACALRAIAELGRNDELPFIAFVHQLERLDPAGDEPSGWKAGGLARGRLVEDVAVDRPTLVGHGHHIGGTADLLAVAGRDDLVLKTARCRHYARRARIVRQEFAIRLRRQVIMHVALLFIATGEEYRGEQDRRERQCRFQKCRLPISGVSVRA